MTTSAHYRIVAVAASLLVIPHAATAIQCPRPSEQYVNNISGEAELELRGMLSQLVSGGFTGNVNIIADNLFAKYGDVNRMIVVRDIISIGCQVISESTQWTDDQKIQHLNTLTDQAMRLMPPASEENIKLDEARRLVNSANQNASTIGLAAALTVLNEHKEDFKGLRLVNQTLRGVQLQNADLTDVDFSDSDLSGANLSNTNLLRTKLQGANLENANLSSSRMSGAKFQKSYMLRVNLEKASIQWSYFNDSQIAHSNMKNTNIESTHFDGADLSRVDLAGAKISWCTLDGTSLYEANMANAHVRGWHMRNVMIDGANVSDADLQETSFSLDAIERMCISSLDRPAKLATQLINADRPIKWKICN